MISYFLGGLVGYSAALLVTVFMRWSEVRTTNENDPWFAIAVALVVLPASVQGLVGDHFGRTLGKHLFHDRSSRGGARFAFGLATSVVVLATSAVAMPFIDPPGGDAALTGYVALFVSFCLLFFLRSVPKNSCVVCGYSLQSALLAMRCPECGAAVERNAAADPRGAGESASGLSCAPHGCNEQARSPHAARTQGGVS